MLTKRLAQFLGIFMFSLTTAGLIIGRGHILGVLDADRLLAITRTPIVGMLLFGGFFARDRDLLNNIMNFLGCLLLGVGIIALISPTIFGLLSTAMTGFDSAVQLILGMFCLGTGVHRPYHTLQKAM